jgi:hypothetical protein
MLYNMHEHAAWTWTCNTDMYMQHEHAVWTRRMDMQHEDMIMQHTVDMDMQHWNGHAAWT